MGNLPKIRHRMFAKPPMSENTCRGDRPVAPTEYTNLFFRLLGLRSTSQRNRNVSLNNVVKLYNYQT